MKNLCTVVLGLGLVSSVFGIEVVTAGSNPAVKRAALELKEYTAKMGASADKTRFILKVDQKLKTEQWKIVTTKNGIELTGGSPRGVLYAANHYLEDVCGVRWWSPREESVPKMSSLPKKQLNLSGVPAFKFRGIYSLYARDKGRFASRIRLNDDGNELIRITPEYGGTLFFGPPSFCHTFGFYIPDKMYKTHPEWFSLINGKRYPGKGTASDSGQFCLSNKSLRAEFKRRLREFIKQGEAKAKKEGIEAPLIYEIGQNDNSRFCECANCKAIEKREGALSGLIIDFINDIARDIAKDYPNILIRTAAYNKTEIPPKHIHPEKNVLIDISNMRGNSLFPADPKTNPVFYNYLTGWARISSHMMVWDYNINYREYNELSYPSEYAYQDNLKFYRKNKVEWSFAEFESPIYSDVREYKIYLWAKLLENPDQDFRKLCTQFANGYYGPAGKLFLEYRDLLRRSVLKHRPYIIFTPTPDNYTHLDIDTVTAANKIFAEGEKLLAKQPVYLNRWRDAKISLNRGILYRSKILKREYMRRHGSLKGYPFTTTQLAAELREVWNRRLPLRQLSQSADNAKKELENALSRYNRDWTEKTLRPPKRFSHTRPDRLIDYTMENSNRFRNFAELVDDPETEVGYAARIQFPHKNPTVKAESHRLPLAFGICLPSKKYSYKGFIKKENIKGRGYNWYKLGQTILTEDAYVFCFPSWLIQQPVVNAFRPDIPKRLYEFWVKVKFTGPAYPFGKAGEPDAIWVERIVLIRYEK